MPHAFADLAFTAAVKAAQERYGSRAHNERLQARDKANDVLGEAESAFIAARDSFYIATVSETGWPYVQHRGGPAGFVRVVDARTLGFADFRGNVQYVSVGNAAANDRASLFFMDYANRARLKVLGRLRIVDLGDATPEMTARLVLPDYAARVERLILVEIAAFDWNCSQHIAPRYTVRDVAAATEALRARIAELEAEVERLRGGQAGT